MTRNGILWICIIILDLILVFLNESTFDGGDSILHYVESHQAWQTPHYFMDMWSKPIFILLSSPFAALGWWGIKLFNTTCILISVYLTKRIFEFYSLNGWWGVFLCFFAYSFFLIQSSGLTEPLFALSLIAIVYFELKDKTALASGLLSFLPFIRSEGYIIAIIFLVYLLFAKRYKYIIYLLLGHVIYGIIGLFVFQDFLWMFNQNPYSGVEIKYGSGEITHFIEQMPYVIGLPIYILFCLGIIRGGIRFFKGQMLLKEFILLYGITIGYIAAHTIFWRYGLFHSFGLTRVLIVIIPFIAFIAYRGLEWLHCSLHFINQKYINGLLIAVIIVFPFIHNKMAMDLPSDIQNEPLQELLSECANWITNNDDLNSEAVYTSAYYYAIAADKIIDNQNQIIQIKRLKDKNHTPRRGSLIIWDSYFAPTDAEISRDFIEKKFKVKELHALKKGNNSELIIYQIL
ncbi:MAG: hypothetical protein COA58_02520 [Bacteroidetes bacterium]|nr:MAG: hypothetical protein COA58_02520 [Bacteroidota bacterium]